MGAEGECNCGDQHMNKYPLLNNNTRISIITIIFQIHPIILINIASTSGSNRTVEPGERRLILITRITQNTLIALTIRQ